MKTNDTITLDHILNCRRVLEADIRSLICQYTKETNTTVTNIELAVVRTLEHKAGYPREVVVKIEY